MADRIGVINKGEIILVEDKAALMEKLGKKQLTLHLANAARGASPPRSRHTSSSSRATRRSSSTPSTPSDERSKIAESAAGARRARYRVQGSADPRELARGDLRQPREGARMNLHAIRAIYLFEMSRAFRTLMQSIAAPVISTSLYFVVFGSAIGSRMTEVEGIQLRRLHHPGPHDALAAEREHLERVVRHLHAEVLGDDLRGAVGADLVRRDHHRLRRGGGVEVDHARGDHPRHGAVLRRLRDRPPGLDGRPSSCSPSVTFSMFGFIIGLWADGFEKLQLVPMLIVTPAHLPGRQLLLDQHAAALLAEGDPVQPGRLSDQRRFAGASTTFPTSAWRSAWA